MQIIKVKQHGSMVITDFLKLFFLFLSGFLKVKEGSLAAAFQGCRMHTESTVQRILKDAIGVSSAFLEHPQSFAHYQILYKKQLWI